MTTFASKESQFEIDMPAFPAIKEEPEESEEIKYSITCNTELAADVNNSVRIKEEQEEIEKNEDFIPAGFDDCDITVISESLIVKEENTLIEFSEDVNKTLIKEEKEDKQEEILNGDESKGCLKTANQLQLHTNVTVDTQDKTDSTNLGQSKELEEQQTHQVKCVRCNISFSLQSMFSHCCLQSGTSSFQCLTCQESFTNKISIRKHVESIHINGKFFECSICNKIFAMESKLKQHIREHAGAKPFVCLKCNRIFQYYSNFVRHRDAHNRKNRNLCQLCTKSTVDKSTVVQRVCIHKEQKSYDCPFEFCNKRFAYASSLSEHIQAHNRGRLFSCSKCNFRSQKQILSEETEEKQDICLKCKKDFPPKTYLRIHSGKKLLECMMCERKFCHKGNLIVHLRSHTEKSFKCLKCSKCFSDQAHLSMHERVHSDDLRYVCEKCNKRFSKHSDLQQHGIMHNEKSLIHECKRCLKCFTTSRSLSNHFRMHEREDGVI